MFNQLLERLWNDESGQDLVEYVLIIVLIALAVTAALSLLGEDISNAYSETGANLESQLGG